MNKFELNTDCETLFYTRNQFDAAEEIKKKKIFSIGEDMRKNFNLGTKMKKNQNCKICFVYCRDQSKPYHSL